MLNTATVANRITVIAEYNTPCICHNNEISTKQGKYKALTRAFTGQVAQGLPAGVSSIDCKPAARLQTALPNGWVSGT
jgi:hypothetical protein